MLTTLGIIIAAITGGILYGAWVSNQSRALFLAMFLSPLGVIAGQASLETGLFEGSISASMIVAAISTWITAVVLMPDDADYVHLGSLGHQPVYLRGDSDLQNFLLSIAPNGRLFGSHTLFEVVGLSMTGAAIMLMPVFVGLSANQNLDAIVLLTVGLVKPLWYFLGIKIDDLAGVPRGLWQYVPSGDMLGDFMWGASVWAATVSIMLKV